MSGPQLALERISSKTKTNYKAGVDLSGAVAAVRAAGSTYQGPLTPGCVSIIIGMQTFNE